MLTLVCLCGDYPMAKKIPYSYQVGQHEIQDDYFWLRDDARPNIKNKQILDYLNKENVYLEKVLFSNHKHLQKQLFQELKKWHPVADVSEYLKKDDYYYYTRTEENQKYKIHCRKLKNLEAKEEVILDENNLAKGNPFMHLGTISISDDHKFLAYAVDFVGNEEYTIKILDLSTQQYLADKISNVGLSDAPACIIWHKNNCGFFYTPASSTLFPEKVMFHKLGDQVDMDKLVYLEKDNTFSPVILRSQDRNFLFINTFSGNFNIIHANSHKIAGNSNEIYFIDLNNDSLTPHLIEERKPGVLYSVEHHNNYFYISYSEIKHGAKLVKTSTISPSKINWQEVVATLPDTYIECFDISKNYLILNYKAKGLPQIEVINLVTKEKNSITFPADIYTTTGYVTNFAEDEIRIYYSSLNCPDTIYKYNFPTNNLHIMKRETPTNFLSEEYEVKREWAENNGVKVPISLIYKKALFKSNGSNPLYLYGYGTYGSGLTPHFRPEIIPLLNKGFVFALAHCRGGDELGNTWYLDGKLLKKKNTFTDFIACSERLIQLQYTAKNNIVISGRSAGGALIGYVVNTRPELYKAAIMHVPFVDVLNTTLDESLPLTTVEAQEWGDPIKDPEVFEYIKSYSPYENIKKQNYPHIFITTSVNDTRVSYWEPTKFVAKLRSYKTDRNYLLLKIKLHAGHAGISGNFEHLHDIVDDYIFIYKIFGILN